MERYEELVDDGAADSENNDHRIIDNGFTLKPHPDVSNPVLTHRDVEDCLARFVADPFIVYNNGVYNMFFEIKSIGGNVFIGHAFSENGLEYEYNKIVIDPETAQHTYPHVFRKDGNWLMVPSPGSNVNGEFRVYKAVKFPTRWELQSIPIQEDVRLDPTPILHDGTWYLIYQNTEYDIVLAHSPSLTGENWQEHPDSPIFENDPAPIEECAIGKAEMVPSGRPVYGNRGINICYRSHINREVYHYRITNLTKETFSQKTVSETPVFDGTMTDDWNRRFMHTVNPLYPWRQSDSIVAVDGLEETRYRYSIGIYTLHDGNYPAD
jgi:hypothetical protein